MILLTLSAFTLAAPAAAAAPLAQARSRRVARRARGTLRLPELELPPVVVEAPEPEVPPPTLGDVGVTLAKIPGPTIPPEIRAMLDAAIAANDEAGVATIVKYARAGDPGSADLVLRQASDWRTARARAHDERLQQASAFELWTGKVEAGGFISTGNSNITGLTGSGDLTREGLRWRHRLLGQADFQRTDGVTSRERYTFGYQPNYKVSDRAYIYGNLGYESDRFLGYVSRYAVSVGAGYGVFRRSGLTLDLEAGPAFRQTDFTDDFMQSSLAARGSMNLNWTLIGGLRLSQEASAYLEHYNSTVRSVSALEAKLLGPLSAKFSYTVQYESEPRDERLSTDTLSRLSLVYSF
jgi:putative salt-induced outer membrane protein